MLQGVCARGRRRAAVMLLKAVGGLCDAACMQQPAMQPSLLHAGSRGRTWAPAHLSAGSPSSSCVCRHRSSRACSCAAGTKAHPAQHHSSSSSSMIQLSTGLSILQAHPRRRYSTIGDNSVATAAALHQHPAQEADAHHRQLPGQAASLPYLGAWNQQQVVQLYHEQHQQHQQQPLQRLPEEVLLVGIDPDTNGAIAVVQSKLVWIMTPHLNNSSSSSNGSGSSDSEDLALHAASSPANDSAEHNGSSPNRTAAPNCTNSVSSSSSSTADVPQLQAYMALPAAVRVYDMPVETVFTNTKTSTGKRRKRRRLDILQAIRIIRQVLQDTAATADQLDHMTTTTTAAAKADDDDNSHNMSSSGNTAASAGNNNNNNSSSSRSSANSSSSNVLLRAVVEVASIQPGNGSLALLNQGYSAGAWTALLASHGFDVTTVHVLSWKKDLGLLRRDKDCSRDLARVVFEQAGAAQDHLLRNKNTHGRAEALLLAAWGLGWSAQQGAAGGPMQGPVRASVQMDAGMHVLPSPQQQQQQLQAASEPQQQKQQKSQQQRRRRSRLTAAPPPKPGSDTAADLADETDALSVSEGDDDADDGMNDSADGNGVVPTQPVSSSSSAAPMLGVPRSLLSAQLHPLWSLQDQQQQHHQQQLDVSSQLEAARAAEETKAADKQAAKERRVAERKAAAAERAAQKEAEKAAKQAAREAPAAERAAQKEAGQAAKQAAREAAAAERAATRATATAAAAERKKNASPAKPGSRTRRRARAAVEAAAQPAGQPDQQAAEAAVKPAAAAAAVEPAPEAAAAAALPAATWPVDDAKAFQAPVVRSRRLRSAGALR